MKKLLALLLLCGCGTDNPPIIMGNNAPVFAFNIGESVWVRYSCRGQIVHRPAPNVYVVNPLVCANGFIYHNIMVNEHELSR
jgi:hypothetical protein